MRCRYTPELNRRCTHLIAPTATSAAPLNAALVSRKLQLVHVNRLKWPTQVVSFGWLLASCATNSRAPEAEYALDTGAARQSDTEGPGASAAAGEHSTRASHLGASRPALADVHLNQLPGALPAASAKPATARGPSSKVCRKGPEL